MPDTGTWVPWVAGKLGVAQSQLRSRRRMLFREDAEVYQVRLET